MNTVIIRTNAQLRELNLSFYTLSKLADVLQCVNPMLALENRLTHPAWASKGWKGELTLDELGNFVSFA